MVLEAVAWLGLRRAEKNLEALKHILERLPSSACLCFVGDGPSRPDLAKHFEGLPVFFTVRCRLPLLHACRRMAYRCCSPHHSVALAPLSSHTACSSGS